MNAGELLRHYGRVADAPDAVVRLRRFILDLAVRGKLVPQDPRDEPAPIPSGHGRDLDEAVTPFEIPSSWAWVNVGAVAEARLGKMLDRGKNKGLPRQYLRNVNVRWFDFDLSDLLTMKFEDAELPEFALRVGDVLICEGGEPGRAAVWDNRATDVHFQKALHRVRFTPAVDSTFFVLALRSSADDGRVAEYFTGTGIRHFTGKALDAYGFPLPPLAEQHRIVAKVDELMALCDRLEAARAQREAARDRLARSCLSRLDTPDPETFREDARFALDALPALAARPDQIKRLRQTILNLAVRGRLVPQDSSDQSASDLLIRIANDKAPTAVNRGKPGRDKSAVLPKGAWPFMPPAGWAWVAFGDIVKSRDGDRIPVSREERNGRAKVYDYYGASGVIDKIDKYLFDKPLLLIGEDGANLVNRSTPIAFIARGKYWVNNHAHVLDALSEEMLRYLELFINATDLMPYITGTAQPKINQAKMNSIPVALPPLAEQSRIVAKVDELMALCDRLEASLQRADEHRRRLLEALLHQALEPAASLEEQVA